MNLAEIVLATPVPVLPTPVADPFLKDDLLAEADLQKVQWDVAVDRCGLLFDLKGAYQYPEANTALLVAVGVSRLTWSGRSRERRAGWGTFMVGSNTFSSEADGLAIVVGAIDSQRIELVADQINFWEGNVPGADEAPPSYDEEDDDVIRAGLTSWDSEFHPVAADVRYRPRFV